MLVGLAVFLVCAVNVRADADAVKKEMAILEGEWSMVSGERDGGALPDEVVKSAKRVSKAGETTVSFGDQLVMKAKFTVDPSKTPKAIDYEVSDGPNKGKKVLGIYKLDGDTATFCFAQPDKERPTKFETKADSGLTLSTWKKNKK
jgi:uncharacterized protein (TIGR03067 family)